MSGFFLHLRTDGLLIRLHRFVVHSKHKLIKSKQKTHFSFHSESLKTDNTFSSRTLHVQSTGLIRIIYVIMKQAFHAGSLSTQQIQSGKKTPKVSVLKPTTARKNLLWCLRETVFEDELNSFKELKLSRRRRPSDADSPFSRSDSI